MTKGQDGDGESGKTFGVWVRQKVTWRGKGGGKLGTKRFLHLRGGEDFLIPSSLNDIKMKSLFHDLLVVLVLLLLLVLPDFLVLPFHWLYWFLLVSLVHWFYFCYWLYWLHWISCGLVTLYLYILLSI